MPRRKPPSTELTPVIDPGPEVREEITESSPQSEAAMLVHAIIQTARDPDLKIDKMERLWEFKERIDARQAQESFTRAFVKCRAELKPIVKNAYNEQTKSFYAQLEAVDVAISPVLARYGFAFTFSAPESDEKSITVRCKLLHESGHAEPYVLKVPLDSMGLRGTANKTEMHALGASVSYARRYLKYMVFDLALKGEDKDGNRTLRKVQLEQLRDVLSKCDAIRPGVTGLFCDNMGVATVEDIPEGRFLEAYALAHNKLVLLRKQGEGKQGEPGANLP